MTFDYEERTRKHYQNPQVAAAYHAEYTSLGGVNGMRFRVVANRERKITKTFLRSLRATRVLDIPTGAGKMAPVYMALGVNVVAADISKEMLKLSHETYAGLGYGNVRYEECEAEYASRLAASYEFDTVVCIRLMHRVPEDRRSSILKQFAETASSLIVSYGVDSTYHQLRRAARRLLIGGSDVSVSEFNSLDQVRREIEECFRILECKAVLPGLSNEYIFCAERL